MKIRYTVLAAALLSLASLQAQSRNPQWKTLDGKAPLIIGHRGNPGFYPDHTLEGYRRAIEFGADFIEPDLVSTKDGFLIARHEPVLTDTTDVATRPDFASRKTTRLLDGIATTGWWASDFTLAEIKQLRAIQPRGDRSTAYNGLFSIPTFEEILDLAQAESSRRGRTIGVYPETKHPTFHFSLGLALEDKLLATLAKYGYTSKNSPVIIQSFESGSLKYMRPRTNVRLVQLIDADDVALDGKLTYAAPYDKPYNNAVNGDKGGFADMVTPAGLAEIAKYADGIGPWKRYIVSVKGTDANGDKKADDINSDGKVDESDTQAMAPTTLVSDAHAAGLFVHAFTFRNEKSTLAADYAGDARKEYQQYFLLGVDGVFSDYADSAFDARQQTALLVP